MKKRRKLILSVDDFDPQTFKENEKQANKSLAIASTALAVLLTLIFILVIILVATKVIKLSSNLIYYGMPLSIILLCIPACFIKTKFIEKNVFKFFVIAVLLFAVAIINIVEPIHGVLGFAIVMLASCHFYSRKLLNTTFISIIILVLVCLYAGTFFGDWDANLVGISEISAPSFLVSTGDIADISEFVDNIKTRALVIKRLYETEGVNRYLNIFLNYFITRIAALAVIYFITLQLSSRTYNILTKVSQNVKTQERIGGELELASAIQLNFIPTDFPNTEEYEILGYIHSAKEIGGDFYDFFTNKKGELIFNIGDVSGKGIPGSLTMMRAKTLIKSFALSNNDMSDVMEQTNTELCIKNTRNIFVTSVIGKLNLDSGEVILSNAAHNPPLMRKNGKFEYLNLPKGFVLGGLENIIYKDTHLQLMPGDQILFYTDGVTEAMNEKDEMFGEERLLSLLSEHPDLPLKELLELIEQSIISFRGDAVQNDDITMLAVEYKGNKTMKREITVDTLPENVDVLSEFVNSYLEKYTDNKRAIAQINVAIDELFSNIVKFAYHPEIGKAKLRIELRKDPVSIRITFIDHGRPFNPLDILSPDTDLSLEERNIGGLGIFIVKKTMDEVTYEYKDGQNILTIKKSL